ncbi:MAG: hypothetical protein U0353_09630 [Sandaracinus sp.]
MSARTSRKSAPGTPVPDGRHHLLIPLSVLTSALLLYGAHVSFGVVLVVAGGFLGLYLRAPSMVRRSREAFDKDALAIRAAKTGDRATRLASRLEQAWALRLFGAPADVHARRAMIAEEAKRPREAREHYRRALAAWEGELPLATLVGYANASYLGGDDVEAVVHFQKVLDRGAMLPRLHVRLAHATLRAGLPAESVGAWLDAADRDAEDEDARREVSLVRALHEAKRGELGRARALLDAVPGEALPELADEVREALAASESGTPAGAISADSTPPRPPTA